jgi:hypothetical protein
MGIVLAFGQIGKPIVIAVLIGIGWIAHVSLKAVTPLPHIGEAVIIPVRCLNSIEHDELADTHYEVRLGGVVQFFGEAAIFISKYSLKICAVSPETGHLILTPFI